MRAARSVASVALWIAAAFAVMQLLIALGVPAFIAWAVVFVAAGFLIEPSSSGRRALRRIRHGRTHRSP